MNYNRFLDQYGNYTFDELSFTEIDNTILSYLSYLDLNYYVSSKRFRKKTIQQVAQEFFADFSKKVKNIYATRKAIKLLKNIKDVKRYKDLLLYNYIYESGIDEQFSALTIEIQPGFVYVAFEGTDQLISGWKEDFMFSYMFPTISQKKAISYVNRNFTFYCKKIILGGHSKGGNLALVSGMYSNFFVKRKIVKIFNNDGPGLLEEQFMSKKFRSIEDRLVLIVPNYSIFGMLLNHKSHYVVVRAMKKGIIAHDMTTWVVKDKEFEKTELSSFSKIFNEQLANWINCYNRNEREKFVVSLFDVFKRGNVNSITDLTEKKSLILKIILETRSFDSETKKMLKDFLTILFRTLKDDTVNNLKLLFHKENDNS